MAGGHRSQRSAQDQPKTERKRPGSHRRAPRGDDVLRSRRDGILARLNVLSQRSIVATSRCEAACRDRMRGHGIVEEEQLVVAGREGLSGVGGDAGQDGFSSRDVQSLRYIRPLALGVQPSAANDSFIPFGGLVWYHSTWLGAQVRGAPCSFREEAACGCGGPPPKVEFDPHAHGAGARRVVMHRSQRSRNRCNVQQSGRARAWRWRLPPLWGRFGRPRALMASLSV
jgi:hypothetical protein